MKVNRKRFEFARAGKIDYCKMGDDDEEETGPIPKKYCCGNETDFEASNISKLNIAVSVFFIGCMIALCALLFFARHILEKLSVAHPDLGYFLEETLINQIAAMLAVIFRSVLNIMLGYHLLIGSNNREVPRLRRWFKFQLLMSLSTLGIGIWIGTWASDPLYWGAFVLYVILYDWYSLWIVKILIGEILDAANRFEGYVHPCDYVAQLQAAQTQQP